MEASDTLLVVGNGLSIDLGYSVAPALDKWSTSCPLSWNVSAPNSRWPDENFVPNTRLLAVLPTAERILQVVKARHPKANDFTLLNAALAYCQKYGNERGAIELRHFVVIAFSVYQARVDALKDVSWALGKSISALVARNRILGAVSFNYDLNLETLIEEGGKKVWDLADVDGRPGGVPVFKPHGSINYEVAPQFWKPNDWDLQYPLNNVGTRVDAGARLLTRNELFTPRAVADIVLPLETSTITSFQAVQRGGSWVRSAASAIKNLLVIGFSYAPVDRGEFNQIVAQLPRSITAIVVNPYPDRDLIKKLRRDFKDTRVWKQGFETL